MSGAQATQAPKSEAKSEVTRPVDAEHDKRAQAEKATREKTKRIFDTFKSADVGLLPFAASLLAAHAFSTVDKMADKSVDEAREWAIDFRRTRPVVWGMLINQNMMGFMKQLRLNSLIEVDTDQEYVMMIEEYSQLASVIARDK